MFKRAKQNVRSQLLARLRESENQAAFPKNATEFLLRANQRWKDGDPPTLEDVLVRDVVEQAESRVVAPILQPWVPSRRAWGRSAD